MEKAKELKEKADSLFRKNSFLEASTLYEDAIAASPDLVLFNNLIACFLNLKEFEKALQTTERAITSTVEKPGKDLCTTHERAAKALLGLGRLEEAEKHAKLAFVNSPDKKTESSINQLISKIEKKKNLNNSKQNTKTAEQLAKESEELRLKGNKCVAAKNYKEAIQAYSAAIELTSDDHRLYSNRALCFCKVMQWQAAIEDCQKALRCTGRPKSFIKPYLRLGNVYIFLKLFHRALDAFRTAKEESPENCREAYEGLLRVQQLVHDFNQRNPETDAEAKERLERSKRDNEVEQLVKDAEIAMILEKMNSGDQSFISEAMKNKALVDKLMYLNAAGIVKFG